ncbi:MCE family protein [Gordonia sp. zg691]|uniref:MCE family protein n=1 Tax=Gordonia jinghuaiqii TaxID=2758710 RepID=A0A7D7M1Q9_9ACTN|nr:MCE family protein [Gordonia jinghuaiqii]MBD0861116.1 MCE family protein [Gordonia jinghuaiqii]MCR5979725.1 MCE family protein [Gordonia jinghuaiqii]QMT04016.1 MCE family protein [Gordonia jinghuaiqii]
MSIGRKVLFGVLAAVLAVALVVVGWKVFTKSTTNTFTAYFPSVASLYKGDPVRVLGVNVGSVSAIIPRENDVKVELRVDRNVEIPADAKAVVVAQSLVSGRFVQMTPVYSGGPAMTDGTDIPMDRTAVPMEWDDIKAQLTRLTEAIGPEGTDPGTAAKAVNVFDENLEGNGEAINASIREVSDVIGTLAAGRGDLFSTIQSLQKLTEALAGSHEQLVQFNGRIASVSSVLAANTTELDEALKGLDSAMSDVQMFIDTNQAALASGVERLAASTKIVADKDEQVRGVLHSAPNQLANFYNIYNPLSGSLSGVFGLANGTNLITLLCGSMDATNRPGTSMQDVDKCVEILAPVLSSISMNYPPFLANPVQGANALPSQLQYQNDDVKARARASVTRADNDTRRANRGSPLGDLLVPFGGDR